MNNYYHIRIVIQVQPPTLPFFSLFSCLLLILAL